MKIKILLLAACLTASNAFADAPGIPREQYNKEQYNKFKDSYGKIEAGITMPKIKNTSLKSHKGFTVGIGGGHKYKSFRSDIMIRYKNIPTAYSAMLNGYLDAYNETKATPYVMLGVGAGHTAIKVKAPNGVLSKINKKRFLWNAGLGFQFKLDDKQKVDLGYRYVQNFGNIGSKTISGARIDLKRLHAHEVLLGLAYSL
jgi:opacity protein-like surface antigen